jgi:hypothetical protein
MFYTIGSFNVNSDLVAYLHLKADSFQVAFAGEKVMRFSNAYLDKAREMALKEGFIAANNGVHLNPRHIQFFDHGGHIVDVDATAFIVQEPGERDKLNGLASRKKRTK